MALAVTALEARFLAVGGPHSSRIPGSRRRQFQPNI